ncbi:unnamed protein product [Urochloa humidicola]
MEEGSSRRTAEAVAALPDELIIKILSRLPAKSLCRFSCVSRAWRALISDPANHRRFAQTLSGLFFSRPDGSRPPWGFAGLFAPAPPGIDTALSFLSPTCEKMELLDSRNGEFNSPKHQAYQFSAIRILCRATTSESGQSSSKCASVRKDEISRNMGCTKMEM